MLTLFTIPKPFQGAAGTAQMNALRTWRALGSEVEILVLGDEEGAAEAAAEVGGRHVPALARTEWGTPLVSDAFAVAAREGRGETLCYSNADMLFLPDLPAAVERVRGRPSLLVGLRVGFEIEGELDLSPGWQERLRREAAERGTRGFERQIDYMAFPRETPWEMPPFAVGRPGWDNWLLYRARQLRLALVDATQVVLVVHQDHGYDHVPDRTGPRWQGPEADQNLAHLPPGDAFGIWDATRVLTERRLQPALGLRHLKRRARRNRVLGRAIRALGR